MTDQERVRVVVPREETISLARAMARENAQAKRKLEPFLEGANAELALPHVRREAKRILQDRNLLITRKLRHQITEFGALYGLQTRGRPGKADEPLVKKYTVRVTESQDKIIEGAATKLKLSVTDFVRMAAADKAREILRSRDVEGSGS